MELSNVTKFLWYWNTLFFPPSLQGAIVARPMMYLALTYDHRLVDGREAVTFLKSIADKIADPARLLLDI